MLIDEVRRVCLPDAEVVVYDFEIDLSDVMENLTLEIGKNASEYNHSANLGGFSEVQQVLVVDDVFSLELNPSQVAHLLLSEKDRTQSLQKKYQEQDVFGLLKEDIEAKETIYSIRAKIYYCLYALR